MIYRPQYFEFARKEMLAFIPPHIRTSLEVGCGTGTFSLNLKERGVECWGIEPDDFAYPHSIGRLDRSFKGTFEETFPSLPKSYFDVIIFNDVLEHMADPWGALELAKALLSSTGCIVSSIPNVLYFPEFIQFLINKDLKYTAGGTFDKTHLRFFTKKSIVRFFEECGFTIEMMEGIHPYVSRKFTLFNAVTLGYFREMKFMQFGVKAIVSH